MASKNEFKTGTDSLITINLAIEGEVISALTQLVLVYYYILNGKVVKFSLWAKDIAESELVADAAAAGLTIHQILFDGELIKTLIPLADTEALKIEDCDNPFVYVTVSYLDSNGEKQEYLVEKPADVKDEDHNCDPFVGEIVKSITTGWV